MKKRGLRSEKPGKIPFLKKRIQIKALFSSLFVIVLLIVINCFFIAEEAKADKVTQSQLEEIEQQWQSSAHALAEVNCSSCHQDEATKQLVAKPTAESCRSCHENSVETFLLGKHGIRTLESLSPLTPAMAHLPMKDSAKDLQMNCNSCHNVHSVNTAVAATDSCLTCHNDNHSLNYQNSPHGGIIKNLSTLPRPNERAVTCATCHLPRTIVGETVLVNHNNTYTLLPRDRMVKEVCLNCHGVEHAYNSIFDDEIVEANFAHPPTQKMQTFELVRALEKKRSSKTE
ncbi:Cytochrome c552 [Hyella patelloides LEGE 07179]|uniref:Cytochrome c552 n=1 Tax=Hyella patelloides LEGE 07179 TaxID=945734 RepID=A0A563VZD7_9CYAN|nr:cytochrome c3 family protein [Hyella patelloides]VEP16737.1 Cytochrome c552 [Hyella patelloides LEGE 07179]